MRSENAVKYAKLLLNASSNPVIPYESPHTSPEHHEATVLDSGESCIRLKRIRA